GDLEFAASRWLERLNDVEYRVVVHVQTGHSVLGLGNLRLLLDLQNAFATDDWNPEPLRILDPFQMDLGALASLHELLCRVADAFLVNVVAENDANGVVLGKMFGEGQRRGNASFSFLIRVVEMLQAEFFAVAEQFQEIAGVFSACHNQ